MAHQARKNISAHTHPRVLENRPELAALLGIVVSEWSALESALTFLYGAFLGIAMGPHIREEGQVSYHPVGFQIFETLVTHDTRLKLIEKLSNLLIKDTEILNELNNDMLPVLRRASKKRNNLVHAYWGINDEEYPNALIKIGFPLKFEIYEASDFNEAIDFIVSAAKTITKFEERVISYLRTIH